MIIRFFIFIIFAGCSSSSKISTGDPTKDLELDWVKTNSFKKEKPKRYSISDDYYEGEEGEKKEGLELVPETKLDRIKVKMSPIKGLIECYKGNSDEGLAIIRSSYSRYKKNPLYYNSAGSCFTLRRDYEKAIIFYNLALESRNNYPPTISNLGVIHYKKGNFNKAFSAFKRAASLAPDATTPRKNLASLYFEYYLFKNIKKFYKEQSNKQDDILYFAEGLLSMEQKDFEKALYHFEKIRKNEAFSPGLELNNAICYLELGEKSRASSLFSKIDIKKAPKLFDHYNHLKRRLR